MHKFDWSDGAIVVGIILLTVAAYLALGGVGAVAFLGVVMLLLGLVGAWSGRRVHSDAKDER